jgi:hypothetical protein
LPEWLHTASRAAVPLVFMALLLQAGSPLAKVYSTKDEALGKAFPGARIERKNIFLTEGDMKKVEGRSGAEVTSRLFTYYMALKGDALVGYAVIDRHTVRTKPEVYMAVIRPDLAMDYVEILAFYEPEEYLPMKRWLNQFAGKYLNDGLWVKRDIQAISGATITSYTLTREIRKVLAILELKIKKVVR